MSSGGGGCCFVNGVGDIALTRSDSAGAADELRSIIAEQELARHNADEQRDS